MTHPSHIPGLDRDGHLSELAIDHYLYAPRAANARPEVMRHLANCDACRASLATMQARDAALPDAAAPLPRTPELAARRSARARSWTTSVGVTVLAIAALFTLAIAPWRSLSEGAPGEFVARGSRMVFTVHLHDGVTTRIGETGDFVRAGDRARFTVSLDEDGYLLIAGMDDRGEAYAGYPLDSAASAVYLAGSLTPLALPTAIEFDDSAGGEHLFAMLCDHPFELAEMRAAMQASLAAGLGVSASEGCTLRRVDFDKRGP